MPGFNAIGSTYADVVLGRLEVLKVHFSKPQLSTAGTVLNLQTFTIFQKIANWLQNHIQGEMQNRTCGQAMATTSLLVRYHRFAYLSVKFPEGCKNMHYSNKISQLR